MNVPAGFSDRTLHRYQELKLLISVKIFWQTQLEMLI